MFALVLTKLTMKLFWLLKKILLFFLKTSADIFCAV